MCNCRLFFVTAAERPGRGRQGTGKSKYVITSNARVIGKIFNECEEKKCGKEKRKIISAVK